MLSTDSTLLLGGLAIGLAFGAIVQQARFCMVAAVANFVLIRDVRHVHAFIAAIAVGVAGTQLLEWGGWVAVGESYYRDARIDWLGALAGGAVFGFGAALAGGCAARTVVRAAEGGIGALVALLAFTVAAAITQFGMLAPWRMVLAERTAMEAAAVDTSVAALLGVPAPWSALAALAIWLALLSAWRRDGRRAELVFAGIGVGLLVTLAWWITGWLARDEFAATTPSALNISGPLARVGYFVATGAGPVLGFGTGFLAGTASGAAIAALATRSFHWTRPAVRQLPFLLVGGAAMGFGATLAGGCNIGQGISGVSTLALESILAAGAIFAGAALGVKWLERLQ